MEIPNIFFMVELLHHNDFISQRWSGASGSKRSKQ